MIGPAVCILATKGNQRGRHALSDRKALPWLTLITLFSLTVHCINLDNSIFWRDEAQTCLWLSGHCANHVIEDLRQPKGVSFLLSKYQTVAADANVLDTIRCIAHDAPEHPPLYYVLANYWAKVFGSSTLALRAFSAALSCLTIPAAYWFCIELFGIPSAALLVAALFALSPFHMLYAQQCREYSLWCVLILVTCGTLLRALRTHQSKDWILYSLSLSGSLYAHLFSLLVAVTQLAYLILTRKVSKTCIVAFSNAALLFLPWLAVVIANLPELQRNMSWTAVRVTVAQLCSAWIESYSAVLFDWNFAEQHSPVMYYFMLACAALALVLGGYALVQVARFGTRASKFLLFLAVIPFAALAVPDLCLGARSSIAARYLMPSFMSMQICLAYLLYCKLAARDQFERVCWRCLLAFIAIAGFSSCMTIAQARDWSNKGDEGLIFAQVQLWTRSKRPPLLVPHSSFAVPELLAICHIVDGKTLVQTQAAQTLGQEHILVVPSGSQSSLALPAGIRFIESIHFPLSDTSIKRVIESSKTSKTNTVIP